MSSVADSGAAANGHLRPRSPGSGPISTARRPTAPLRTGDARHRPRRPRILFVDDDGVANTLALLH